MRGDGLDHSVGVEPAVGIQERRPSGELDHDQFRSGIDINELAEHAARMGGHRQYLAHVQERPPVERRRIRFKVPETGKTPVFIPNHFARPVATIKKRLDLDASNYALLQILSVTLFEKMTMHQALGGDENK